MKTRILSIVLIAVLAISTTAIAQNPKTGKRGSEQKAMMMKRHQQQKGERMANFFTEEQQIKMKELRLETAKLVKPLKNELNELKAKQQTLTTADNADLKAINNNIDKMSELKAGVAKIIAKQHQEIRSMLSDEQLIKFDMMKERKGKKRGNFHAKGKEKGGQQHTKTRS